MYLGICDATLEPTTFTTASREFLQEPWSDSWYPSVYAHINVQVYGIEFDFNLLNLQMLESMSRPSLTPPDHHLTYQRGYLGKAFVQ